MFSWVPAFAGPECSPSPTLGTQTLSSEGVSALDACPHVPDGWCAAVAWPQRRPVQVGGGGSSAPAGGRCACCGWVRAFPRSGSVGWALGGLHPFIGAAVTGEANIERNCLLGAGDFSTGAAAGRRALGRSLLTRKLRSHRARLWRRVVAQLLKSQVSERHADLHLGKA
jgi:hypothetical protein